MTPTMTREEEKVTQKFCKYRIFTSGFWKTYDYRQWHL